MFRRLLPLFSGGPIRSPLPRRGCIALKSNRARCSRGKVFGRRAQLKSFSGKIYFAVDPTDSFQPDRPVIRQGSEKTPPAKWNSPFLKLLHDQTERISSLETARSLTKSSNRGNKGIVVSSIATHQQPRPADRCRLRRRIPARAGFHSLWVGWQFGRARSSKHDARTTCPPHCEARWCRAIQGLMRSDFSQTTKASETALPR
jgi:hypothetical protein